MLLTHGLFLVVLPCRRGDDEMGNVVSKFLGVLCAVVFDPSFDLLGLLGWQTFGVGYDQLLERGWLGRHRRR